MIDLRSDTVTRPCEGMRAAMARAEVGDDVYGDDLTVLALEARLCELTKKEAAVFVPSGTQSNLCALLSHCERGDEYIAGQDAHTYRYEAGGAAVLGGIQPQPIPFNALGELPLESIKTVIKPDDHHFAKTRLLCLENTQGGKPLSLDYLTEATSLARAHNLGCHLDGARVFNAALAVNAPVSEVCAPFDTISICLSKGLGTPMGSVLIGNHDLVTKARRWRKMLGGGLRQTGIVAAAGLYALEHNIDRLSDDHRRASELATHLNRIESLGKAIAHTNMVFLETTDETMRNIKAYLKENDVIISGGRLVLHKDISDSDLDRLFSLITAFAQKQ
jgi:threonine aldolase